MTLQEIADLMRDHAVRMFAMRGKKAEIMPVLHAETADGTIVPVGLPWNNEEQKQQQLATARAILKRINAVRYGIVSEAWAADYDLTRMDRALIRPSQREDRVEIVSIVTADRDGNYHCVAYKIERDHNGCPSVGEEYGLGDKDDTVISEGAMLELFGEPKCTSQSST